MTLHLTFPLGPDELALAGADYAYDDEDAYLVAIGSPIRLLTLADTDTYSPIAQRTRLEKN